jgi:hypothetical protein
MSAENENERDARDDELERKIAEGAKVGVPIATALLAILAGYFVDVATAILILAAGALVAVIAMFWGSLRTLLGETPLSGADAYALGAPPRAEEEQKRAVLRALKDLEFERSVGKISEEDYRALVAKYRAEAKRLLQLLDQEAAPGRERAEALVLRRLRKEGLLEAAAKDEDEREDEGEEEDKVEDEDEREEEGKAEEEAAAETSAPAKEEPAPAAKEPAPKPKKKKSPKAAKKPERKTSPCASCGTTNDEDALFCKKCGASMKAPPPAEAEGETNERDEEATS